MSERVSSARPSSRTSRRAGSMTPTRVEPVLHKPCSATLGKFHDSVNYSLAGVNLSALTKPQVDENDQMAKARNKYKYMLQKKTYVDESLFGSSRETERRQQLNTTTDPLRHLTHYQMSNVTPLMVNPPIFSRPMSGRCQQEAPETMQNRQDTQQQIHINRPKPWKP